MLIHAARVLTDRAMAPASLRALPEIRNFTGLLARIQVISPTLLGVMQLVPEMPTKIIAAHNECCNYSRTEWNTYMMWMHAVANAVTYCSAPGLAFYDAHGRLAVISPTHLSRASADYLSRRLDITMMAAHGLYYGDAAQGIDTPAFVNISRSITADVRDEYEYTRRIAK